ncbi:hypothetical protein M422DRAFT_251765 [Sphaerobolus stellatus SS14]|uniref:Uncharacterized protein n=1 Tax=Sphaerobolus stellatus (strain SS14) TaxID=990650 RepID=A0A0C9W1D1_SPHS4|nr:hypothetical protein M422DRAFT_251765 [Sphaerobolus stellatus SS14]
MRLWCVSIYLISHPPSVLFHPPSSLPHRPSSLNPSYPIHLSLSHRLDMMFTLHHRTHPPPHPTCRTPKDIYAMPQGTQQQDTNHTVGGSGNIHNATGAQRDHLNTNVNANGNGVGGGGYQSQSQSPEGVAVASGNLVKTGT